LKTFLTERDFNYQEGALNAINKKLKNKKSKNTKKTNK
jgi:hypothetical protein